MQDSPIYGNISSRARVTASIYLLRSRCSAGVKEGEAPFKREPVCIHTANRSEIPSALVLLPLEPEYIRLIYHFNSPRDALCVELLPVCGFSASDVWSELFAKRGQCARDRSAGLRVIVDQ